MIPAPRLACEQCKRRKIRCDKGSPCSACKNADLHCHTVQRARLPRGKSGQARTHNAKLESRVARIETLLAQQAELSNPSCLSPPTGRLLASGMRRPAGSEGAMSADGLQGSAVSFVASDFWIALSNEVIGLRETLEGSEEEGGEEDQKDKLPQDQANETSSTSAILFQHANLRREGNITLPPLGMRTELLTIYRVRVDSVYKVLHWPTVLSMVGIKHGCSSATPKTQSSQVLEWSIYFMAMCSITNDEALEMTFGNRLDILQTYRSIVEDLFARSTLLQSPDVVVLQAFVIYLVRFEIGLRTCSSGASTWTLIAVAVRAATSLGLGQESANSYTTFEIELRRRLLFAIGILDTHSALDRGTVPILPSTAFSNPPLNIDDQDISPQNCVPVVLSLGSTDMSHTAMIYEAMICQRRLYELSENAQNTWETWPRKLELIGAFERYIRKAASRIGASARPLETLQKISGEKILISLHLLLRRPPYRQPHDTVPPWDDFNVLDVATQVLEHHMQPLPAELKLWAWKNWVQWHALAIVLAELTTCPNGQLSNRAYLVAVKSFRHYAQIIADSESGMLWIPIARLMRRVEQVMQSACLDTTPMLPKSYTLTSDNSNGLVETIDTNSFPDLSMFDFSDWTIDRDGSSGFTAPRDSDSIGNDIKENRGIPWLAWDSFLQDIYVKDS